MTNEQVAAYLQSIIDSLNAAIDLTINSLPENAKVTIGIEGNLFNPLRTVFPVLDPILEVKESLYKQLETLKGIK